MKVSWGSGRVPVRSSTADGVPQKHYEPSRLTPAYGLKTIEELKKLHVKDLKRTGASIALVRSMQMQTVKVTGRPVTSPADARSSEEKPGRRIGFDAGLQLGLTKQDIAGPQDIDMRQRSSVLLENIMEQQRPELDRRSVDKRQRKTAFWNAQMAQNLTSFAPPDHSDIENLEDAFYAISASFDMDGDGTLDSEELIHIFGRCKLFDEWLTPGKVRDYFRTAAQGCNYILTQDRTEIFANDIDFEDFESILRWSADMKGVSFASCCTKVVRLSRKLCDGRSSDRRKLETVFDAFCKTAADSMTPYEFVSLCKKLDVLHGPHDSFTVADVYSIFYLQLNLRNEGMHFDDFMKMLSIVGEKLGIGDEVYALFAGAVTKLDIDEPTIRRVKLRIKHAASDASDVGWRQFFHECDEDDSGHMDWDEFYHMCRDRLKLTERSNHLKLLFEKLDADDSGELSIDELIDFIEQASCSY